MRQPLLLPQLRWKVLALQARVLATEPTFSKVRHSGVFIIPALEVQKQADPWSLLASQPSLLGEFQTSERL